ncbi:MAG: hypothetical protein CMQ43_14455 [Gammaproteobacteria bacterium]|nr:hypothetical protein [Gammaproteobacteria bacterium]
MTTADQRLSPPRQARSRDTLERFAGAAVTLLASESWDRIAVARLAREARSSVGAFYARFADKDALLDHLDERYARELTSLLQRRRRRLERSPQAVRTEVTALIRSLVRLSRRYRGVLAAVLAAARQRDQPQHRRRTEMMNAELEPLARVIAAALPRATPQDVRIAMAFTFSALRDQVLFPDSVPAAPAPLSDSALTRALVRSFFGYLEGGR